MPSIRKHHASPLMAMIMLIAVRMGNHGAVDWGALQAGVIISILPCFLIYLLLQKYYVSGLLSGGIK